MDEPAPHYLIAGTDPDGNIWVARSEDAVTAHHIAEMFRDTRHVRVTITAPDDPLDID